MVIINQLIVGTIIADKYFDIWYYISVENLSFRLK